MIDVEKVRLMTKISIYEKGIGKEDIRINRWKYSSYVILKTIENIIYVSIAYLLGVMLYFIKFIPNLVSSKAYAYKNMAMHLIVLYIVLMIIVWIFSYLHYKSKYKEAIRRIIEYDKDMDQLEIYLKDEKKKEDGV